MGDDVDYIAMFVTSVGPGVRELTEKWMAEGQYLNAHILQALALESAEGFAELLHQQIRQMWGFGDPAGLSYQDLFRTQYRGRRFSFGYPACPRLEDQEQLFRLLDVTSNIGVELTEESMMDPESSVSAIVCSPSRRQVFQPERAGHRAAGAGGRGDAGRGVEHVPGWVDSRFRGNDEDGRE